MGTWGFGSFENDTALDWIGEFGDNPSVNELIAAMTGVLGEQVTPSKMAMMEYLDDEDACPIAVAAAEVVAAMRGRPHPEFSEELKPWVEANKSAATAQMTETALRAIQAARTNEIFLSCFCDDEDVSQWQSELDELVGRLKQPAN